MIDGPGISLVIYFQGCSIRCPDCHNKSLWEPDQGISISIESLIGFLSKSIEFYDSITFLGGEPLDQIEAVESLATYFHPKILLCLYTGYTVVPENIAKLFDVIVLGPYLESEKNDLGIFPASKNQTIKYSDRVIVPLTLKNLSEIRMKIAGGTFENSVNS